MLDRRKRGHISKYSPPSKIFSIIHLSFFSTKLALPGLTDFIIINFDHPGGPEHFSRPFDRWAEPAPGPRSNSLASAAPPS